MTPRIAARGVPPVAPARNEQAQSHSAPTPPVPRPSALRPSRPLDSATAGAIDAAADITDFGVDVPATASWCVDYGAALAYLDLIDRWSALAAVAHSDVGAARILEPHLDALGIIAQAHAAHRRVDLAAIGADSDSSWGVFAAEGPGTRLLVTAEHGAVTLSGSKPCVRSRDPSPTLS